MTFHNGPCVCHTQWKTPIFHGLLWQRNWIDQGNQFTSLELQALFGQTELSVAFIRSFVESNWGRVQLYFESAGKHAVNSNFLIVIRNCNKPKNSTKFHELKGHRISKQSTDNEFEWVKTIEINSTADEINQCHRRNWIRILAANSSLKI